MGFAIPDWNRKSPCSSYLMPYGGETLSSWCDAQMGRSGAAPYMDSPRRGGYREGEALDPELLVSSCSEMRLPLG